MRENFGMKQLEKTPSPKPTAGISLIFLDLFLQLEGIISLSHKGEVISRDSQYRMARILTIPLLPRGHNPLFCVRAPSNANFSSQK